MNVEKVSGAPRTRVVAGVSVPASAPLGHNSYTLGWIESNNTEGDRS